MGNSNGEKQVKSLYSIRNLISFFLLAISILYLNAPIIAGVFNIGDRRGPKIFWTRHHELLFTLAYEFVYDENARPGLRERPWFYGLQGTPNRAIETDEAIFDFENKIGGEVLLAFRQSQLSEIEARTPVIIGKLEWPETFVTSGVLEVRREKFGIYIVLRRGHDYEGGVLLLGKESYRYAIEQDPTYLRGKLWESGVYHYFRKWKK